MNEYLPPVVTKLKADLSDLVAGLAEARAMVKEFAHGVDDDLRASLSHTAIFTGEGFKTEITKNLNESMSHAAHEAGQKFDDGLNDEFENSGKRASQSLMSTLKGLLWPALITLAILAAPMIFTAVASALTLGLGFIFVAIGAFLLKEQEPLVKAFTELKTTLSNTFKDAAAPMLGPLVEALKIFNNLVKELGPSFKEIFAAIAPGIVPLAQGLAGMFREMMPGLKALAPVIAQVMTAFGNSLPAVGKGLSDMFTSIATNGPAMIRFVTELNDFLGSTFRVLGQIFKAMGDLWLMNMKIHDAMVKGGWDTPWNAWATAVKWVWKELGQLFGSIGHWFGEAGRNIASWATDAAKAIAQWATDTWNSITGWISDTIKAIGDWFVSVGHWFEELPGKVWSWLQALPGVIGRALSAAFDQFFFWLGFIGTFMLITLPLTIKKGLDDLIRAFANWATNTAASLRTWAMNTLMSIVAWGERMKTEIPMKLAELLLAIVKWGTDTYNEFLAWGARTLVGISNWIAETKTAFINWAKDTIEDIKKWWNSLPETLGKAKDAVINWFKSAGTWLKDAGKWLIDGLKNGIEDQIESLVALVKRAMDKVKEGAKKALGISSPSKVFAEMGEYSMQGFIQGLVGGTGQLASAWKALVPNVNPTLALAAQGGGSQGQGVSSSSGPAMVSTTITLDGETIIRALTPAAQRRKNRTGETGLA